jgi:hypothetical protein
MERTINRGDNTCSTGAHYIVRYLSYGCKQCCESGSAKIHIHLAVLDPDQDPYCIRNADLDSEALQYNSIQGPHWFGSLDPDPH